MDNAMLKTKVDEYVRWNNLLSEAKKEVEKFKAEFQKHGVELLNNTKLKQVEFWGSNNVKVVVTVSETVKLVSYQFLKKIMGEDILNDFVKVEPQYKLSEPFKRLLAAIFQGNYMEQSLNELIAQISEDEKIRKTLKKKLKGKWDKDVETLKNIAGLNQQEAEHFAYFVQEAFNFENIVHLLEAVGHEKNSEDFKAAIEKIRHAVVVEEGIKVGVECENGDESKDNSKPA